MTLSDSATAAFEASAEVESAAMVDLVVGEIFRGLQLLTAEDQSLVFHRNFLRLLHLPLHQPTPGCHPIKVRGLLSISEYTISGGGWSDHQIAPLSVTPLDQTHSLP